MYIDSRVFRSRRTGIGGITPDINCKVWRLSYTSGTARPTGHHKGISSRYKYTLTCHNTEKVRGREGVKSEVNNLSARHISSVTGEMKATVS